MTAPAIYSIDTSALLDGMVRYYPPSVFPGVWSAMDTLVDEGRLVASEEVWEEVKVHDDHLKQWMERNHERLVVPTEEAIAREVTAILTGNPRLVGNLKGRNRADPFVIAVARVRGATVVTGEGADGTAARPKIPYVCQQLSPRIPCCRLLDLIVTEGWSFS